MSSFEILSFLGFPAGISGWESACWCWCWSSNALATCCDDLTHWKRPWCWDRLRAGAEGGDRGWDGWIASLIQRTGLWANSRIQWRTGKSGVLQSMGLQRARQDWGTEQKLQQLQGEACIPKMKSSPGSLQLERKPSRGKKNLVQPKLFKKLFKIKCFVEFTNETIFSVLRGFLSLIQLLFLLLVYSDCLFFPSRLSNLLAYIFHSMRNVYKTVYIWGTIYKISSFISDFTYMSVLFFDFLLAYNCFTMLC